MTTGPVTFFDLLHIDGVPESLLAEAPTWLWDVEAGRIVFANAAGIAFFRDERLSQLQSRHFDLTRPGLAALARAPESLPRDGTARLLMLRFFIGARDVAVASMCRLVADRLVLVTANGSGAGELPLKERAGPLFDELDLPVALFDGEEPVYQNPAALGASGGSEAFHLEIGEGRMRLVIGMARSDRAEEGGQTDASREAVDAAASAPEQATPGRMGPAAGSPRRFSFALDAEGRFVEVGPALAEAVGAHAADLFGRHWADTAQSLGLDPSGAVSTALRSRDAWGGIVVDWPSDNGGVVKVHLAAQPRLADGGIFIGYRGFGDVMAVRDVADQVSEPSQASGNEHNSNHDVPAGDLAGSGAAEHDAARLNDAERDAFRTIAEALEGFSAPAPLAEDDDDPQAVSRPRIAGDAEIDAPTEEDTEESRPQPPETPASALVARDAAGRLATSILDRMPHGIAVTRNDSVLYANAAFLDTFGYSDVDDLEIAGGLAALFAGERGGLEGTVAARRREGAPITVEAKLGRLEWIDGPAMFVAAREVASATAQPAVADDDVAELRAILDTATDGLLVLSPEGSVEAANRSAEALLGCEAGEIKGYPLEELVAEESRSTVRDYFARLAAGGVGSLINDGCEIVARAARGEVVLFLTLGRIGEGSQPRYCAVMRDLTEWKAAEAELIAARKRAEAANAQKSDFLAKISHEIRTPLNAIIGFAEVMLEERFGPVANERYREYIKDMRASGEHIMSLVNDLLDLSKVEAGRLELNFTQVNLNDIIEQSVAIMQPQANSERVIIRASLANGLPAVVADARSMRQVMLNLLSNAIKFTPAGGQAFVSTAIGKEGVVTLRVRDTGIGMSEGDIETALEPFRQVAVHNDDPKRGTGLGLPLTRALVEANRAGFVIRSRLNEGTLVEISFPPARVLAG